MSGYESYNTQGFMQFSSRAGQRTLIAGPAQTVVGYMATTRGHAYWARLRRGTVCAFYEGLASVRGAAIRVFNGGGEFKQATDTSLGVASGYLDVYDEQGQRTWSAAAQANIPNIQGVISVSASEAAYGSGGAYLDDDMWVCMSAAHVFDGNMAGEIGLELERTAGGVYRLRGVAVNYSLYQLQEGLASTIYMPYARFAAKKGA